MERSNKGVKQSEEWIEKRIHIAGSEEAKKYGKEKTEEERQYLSENSPKFWEGKTRDEETKRKISETKKAKGLSNKRVYKIDVRLKTVAATYESTTIASKLENVGGSSVSRWCSVDRLVDGFIWTYKPITELNVDEIVRNSTKVIKEIEPKVKTKYIPTEETRKKLSNAKLGSKQSQEHINKRIESVVKPVVKVDKVTNTIIERFASLAEAGKHNTDSMPYEAIQRICNGCSPQSGDIIWCYEENFLNNLVPEYQKAEVVDINGLTEDFINSLYSQYRNGFVSIRELSKKHSINFSTLSNIFQKLERPVNSLFGREKEYLLTCKITSKQFTDYLNKSGCITNHIQAIYPEFVLESKYKRQQVELKTGKPWYYDYFDFKTL